jgi:cobalt-zinc-cadmium efflux system protein
MNTLKNMKIAFILNLLFSIIEAIGGTITGSVAIVSDAVHDLGDACSIAAAIYLEKKSKNNPNENYTFGYLRFSVLGAFITSTILTIGSILVLYNAIPKLFNPEPVNYNGMMVLAIIGCIMNFAATRLTSHTENKNEKSVCLHMLEDVLGWVAVLVGSLIIKFTGLYVIDAVLSVGITVFILINVIKNYIEIFNVFLERAPKNINLEELKNHLKNVKNVKDIHHIHLWTMDGINNYATIHVLVDENTKMIDIEAVKRQLKEELKEHNISHSVIEFETCKCVDGNCKIEYNNDDHMGHHH